MSMPETLVLSGKEIRELLALDECIAAVERAFRLHWEGRSLDPAVLGVPARGGGFHVKAAGLDSGRLYFAAKTNGNFPGNPERHGLPTIQGVLVLCDGENGAPLAVMDSIAITTSRTAAATAVAAKHLAREDSRAVTVFGCGEQGRTQLRALTRVLAIERAFSFDLDPEKAESFARDLSSELGIEVSPVDDPAAVSRSSDVIITATPSRRAFLTRDHLSPGTFVAAVGADSDDKQEVDPALVASSTLVVDVLDSCASIGELHHALAAGLMTREGVHAELAEVVAGAKKGRRSAEEITLFDSTGTAIEDVAAAARVYEKAIASGAGVAISFAP